VFNYHGCFAINYDAIGAQDIFDRQRTSGEAYPALDVWLISFCRTKRSQWEGVIQMDPKRPKIQSYWIQMKPTPLRSAYRADFDNIFFFENGLHMAKISRSEFFPKHANKSKSMSTFHTVDVSSMSV
jgi:hypothetical protein